MALIRQLLVGWHFLDSITTQKIIGMVVKRVDNAVPRKLLFFVRVNIWVNSPLATIGEKLTAKFFPGVTIYPLDYYYMLNTINACVAVH